MRYQVRRASFPLTVCFLVRPDTHPTIDFVVRLVRTEPGPVRDRLLGKLLEQLVSGSAHMFGGSHGG